MSESTQSRWEESYVSDHFELLIGGTPSRSNNAYWDNEKLTGNKWVSIKDIKERYISETEEQITDLGVEESNVKIIPENTVIMSFKLTIGRLTITKRPLYTNEAIVSFIPKKSNSVDTNYLYYGLQSWNLSAEVDQAVKGATLNKGKMSRILGLFPPLPEQKKIASILTSVDEVIETTQKQIDKLQDLKKATMNELLTKGIGHTEFKDSELGRIPKSWEVKPLSELSNKVGSGVTPRGGASVYQNQGIIFIRSQNVHFDGLRLEDVAYISEEIHAGMQGSIVFGGDVLLNITGASIGRCTVVPDAFAEANVNQHVCIIRTTNSLHNKFLNMWLSSDYGQDQIMRFQAGGNREGLNFEQIRSIQVPIPHLDEQERVGKVVDAIQTSINEVQLKLVQTQSLKKSLMQNLLTGKVRVGMV